MNLFQLITAFQTIVDAIQWLQQRDLLATRKVCPRCQERMKIQHDSSEADGCRFRCPGCRKVLSIRCGSFFEKSHLNFKTVITIMYCWANKMMNNQVLAMLKGGDNGTKTVQSPRAVQTWFNYCRDIATQYLGEQQRKIGGPGIIVEIDESHLGAKRKYHRGRAHPGVDKWIFGGICRNSKRAFVRCVPNRTRDTLIPIIQENIEAGSIIYSDTWAPYFTLGELGYTHHMVNHSREFVSADGVCTNGIESLWGEIKAGIKIRRGFTSQQVDGYLDEFMYRREFHDPDFFEVFLGHVAEFYNVNDY